MSFELRPYQIECINKVEEAFLEFRKVSTVLATGTGKAIISNEIARREIAKGKRVLLLAHRDELLEQAASKMMAFNGIEHALIKADKKVDVSKMFFIGSVQSLSKEKRLHSFDRDWFSLIIVDETHHLAAKTYQDIINYFSEARVYGTTATFMRSDGKKLAKYFDTMAYKYDMEDAINDGWLSNVISRVAGVGIDISKVRTVSGDFVLSELDDVVTKYFNRIARYVSTCLTHRKRIMIFTPRVVSADILAQVLKKHGLSAEFVCGESKNRKEIISDFKEGKIRIIVSSLLLTEGFDCPEVDCIINLRPTQSKGMFTQILGRGTRITPNKENILFIDFLWKTDKHVMSPCDIFASTQSVAITMKDFLITNSNKSFDMIALNKYISLITGGMQKMEDARLKCLLDLSKRGLSCYESYAFLVNNINILNYTPFYEWEKLMITDKQLSFLQDRCGINAINFNKGFASLLISDILKRIEEKKCTVKQMFFLAKRGMSDTAPGMTMLQASEIMNEIAENKWIVPVHIKKKFSGEKRLKTPLINVNDLKIKPVEEGERECAKMF